MTGKPGDVREYLASLPEEQRSTLDRVRELIKGAAPEAVESISYGMPAYKYRGKPLVYFGAAKRHWALYGAGGDAYPEVLARYETSKGAIRFPWDEAVAEDVVRMVVADRMAAIDEATEKS